MAIYDTMQWVSCEVATYCIGQCASMGSLLLAAAPRATELLPHGRIMIHQPWPHGRHGPPIPDPREEFLEKKRSTRSTRSHTGQTLERLQEDTDRDRFMSPEEARDYGPHRQRGPIASRHPP